MSLAKIDQTDEVKLVFDVQLSGTKQDVSDYRFVIENDDYSIVCKGKSTPDGVQVQIPRLKGILGEGVYKAALEIVIGDRIFTPLTEVVEVLPNIELKVESKEAQSVEPKEEIKVAVAGTKVTSIVQEAKKQGYTVVDVKNRKALKKDGVYVGIIENEELVLSENAHDFVTDLFEELDNK